MFDNQCHIIDHRFPIVVNLGYTPRIFRQGIISRDRQRSVSSIAKRDPSALAFGTGIASTRAERPFDVSDIDLVENVFDTELAGNTSPLNH